MDDTGLVVYCAPRTRSSTVLWMLEEASAPHRIELLHLKNGDHKKPAYLAVNPMGKVPAIRHGDVVVTETGAICAYLADAFPAAQLAPPMGNPDRGAYYRWLFYAAGCMEPAIADKAFQRAEVPAETLGYGNFDMVVETLAVSVSRADYLAGASFTAADLVVASLLRFGMMFKVLPEREEFAGYVGRMTQREAFKRSLAREEELSSSIEG